MSKNKIIPCPRCEGQKYDKGNCFLCKGTGKIKSATEDFKPLDLSKLPKTDAQFDSEGFKKTK
jgi:hypothetical protein